MSTLPLYWKLSSSSKDERISASVTLISALEDFQSQFTSPSGDDGDDGSGPDEGQEGATRSCTLSLDTLNSEDVRYAIRRLTRGLASPRENSRLGFVVALTELLTRLNTITSNQVIMMVMEASQTQGSLKGQEGRDMLFARLFGLTSVVQSGLLYRTLPLASTTTPATSFNDFQTAITQLLGVGDKKSWLKESAWWSVLLAIETLHDSQVEWKQAAVAWAVDTIFQDHKDWFPEKLAAVLKLRPLFPNVDWQAILAAVFKGGDLLSPNNLFAVARILRDFGDGDDEVNNKKKGQGSFVPQLHFVWDLLLDQYLALPQRSIQDFFRILVDESLFSPTSSPERKYLGFLVFERTTHRVPAQDVPLLFTKNFMRTWINHLSRDDRYLHKAAKHVAVEIQKAVEKTPNIGFALVLQLLGENGNRQFDKITRTKTVESILASMTVEGVKEYVNYLIKAAYDVESADQLSSEPDAVEAKRGWVASQMLMLIRNGSIPKDDDWIMSVLEYLALHGFFIFKKKSGKSTIQLLRSTPKVPFSDQSHETCRQAVYSALADLFSQVLVKREDGKAIRISGVASDGHPWISKLVQIVDVLENDSKHVASLKETTEEDVSLRKRCRHVVDKLHSVLEDRRQAAQGMEILLNSMYLESFDNDSDGTDSFEESIKTAKDMFSLSSRKKYRATEKSGEDEKPEPIDVILDKLIGYLESSTTYTKALANLVFGLMTSELEGSSIELLTKQLIIRDPNPDEADEEEVEEELETSDETQSETRDEDHEGASSSGSGGDNDEVDEGLRSRIAEALKVEDKKMGENEGDEMEEDESEEEELMDDDQMLALDEKLAEIFKSSQKNTKKDRQGAQREANNFIIRVLDLVESFIKHQPASRYIPTLIPPLVLLSASSGPSEKHLSTKATTLLRSRISKLKDVPQEVDVAATTTALTTIHEMARKASSPDLVQTIGQVSLYLVRVLVEAKALQEVKAVYLASVEDYFTRRSSKLKVEFLQTFVHRYPTVGWALRDRLLELGQVGSSVFVFRQIHAFQLVQALLTQATQQPELRPSMPSFMVRCRKAILDVLTDAHQPNGTSVNTPQMKELFKFALFLVRQTRRVVETSETFQDVWPPGCCDSMSESLGHNETFSKSAPIQSLCKQLLASITKAAVDLQKTTEEANTTSGKRKANAASDNKGDEPDESRKKKRKKVKKSSE